MNPCCHDENALNYFAMICFSNGGRTRERLSNGNWGEFDEFLGVAGGATKGVSDNAGNKGKLSMHIDVSETVPLIDKVGTYVASEAK